MSLESFPPYVLTSTRFIISGSIMIAGALARGARLPRGKDLWKAGLSGILILSIGNGCLTFAELRIPSGLASLIITLSPFWLVGIEAMAPGGERLHIPTILGMIVGFAGATLLLSGGIGSGGFSRAALGGFLLLQIGMVSWSAGSIYQRRQEVDSHPIVIGAIQQLFAGLAVLPFRGVCEQPPDRPERARRLGVVIPRHIRFYRGIRAYAFPLDRLPVAVASIYPYVNSLVAVDLGWLFYREPFGTREAAAKLVVFTSVAVVK